MARFPIIESPCPIAGKGLPSGRSEHCNTCDRAVHNLNLMSTAERATFMRSCSGKVCVAYTIKVPAGSIPFRRTGLAAASLAAAALMSLPLAAQELPSSPVPGAEEKLPDCDEELDFLLVGGISVGEQAEWVDDGTVAEGEPAADLPEIEDDGR